MYQFPCSNLKLCLKVFQVSSLLGWEIDQVLSRVKVMKPVVFTTVIVMLLYLAVVKSEWDCPWRL